MNLDELRAAGVYDPAAPDADERRALLELASAAGADLEEIRLAIGEGWLHALPIQRAVLGGEERLSVGEAATRVGLDPGVAVRIWRALGLDDSGPRTCSDADLSLFEWYAYTVEVWGEEQAVHLARVTGASLSRLADAEVSLVRSALEAPLRSSGGDNVAVARAYDELGRAVLPGLQAAVARVHLHQISVAGRRYALWGVSPTEESTTDVVIGFADLVGFTTLGNRMESGQVDALLRTFEARAQEAATGSTTRLVKLIGDEAMFVAGSASDALAVARALLEDPDLPPLRVGMASGEVVTRAGDVFGPPVNLAARLVSVAVPGEILLDARTAANLGADEDVEPRGARTLPGFPAPVDVVAVRPRGA